MIAQLLADSEVELQNKKGKAFSILKAGEYLYIKPVTDFFSATANAAINMVLFEIK